MQSHPKSMWRLACAGLQLADGQLQFSSGILADGRDFRSFGKLSTTWPNGKMLGPAKDADALQDRSRTRE